MGTDGIELSTGSEGEIWLKGRTAFLGYLNNPQNTVDAVDTDGFFNTGDVGYQDEQGFLYVTDRTKELIKYKGFQVAPAEVEGILSSHPKVADAGVIGVYSDNHATELPRGYVVLSPGVLGDEKMKDELTSWLAGQVANHKRLRGGIIFVDAIPRSASGKILRRVLKANVSAIGVNNKAFNVKL
jgi:4-coumarate--CoA ligase